MTTAYAYRRRDWEKRRILYGPQSVPAEQVREHVLWLKSQGLSDARIAELASVSRSTVYRIKLGYASWVGTANARRILAVFGTDPGPDSMVLNVGIRRRIEALQLQGWTLAEIGRRLGVNGHVWDRCKYKRIKHSEAQRFLPILDQLSNETPPLDTPGQRRAAGKARHTAERRGYVNLLAWDDIDDPAEKPKRKRGKDMFGGPDRASIVRRRLAEGATVRQAALDAGVSERTAYRLQKKAA